MVDAANMRLGDACKLSAIYYRLEEEADKFEGSIVGAAPSGGTQGRILVVRAGQRLISEQPAVFRFYEDGRRDSKVVVQVVRNPPWLGVGAVSIF